MDMPLRSLAPAKIYRCLLKFVDGLPTPKAEWCPACLVVAGSCRRGVALEGSLKFKEQVRATQYWKYLGIFGIFGICMHNMLLQLHVLNEKFKNKQSGL